MLPFYSEAPRMRTREVVTDVVTWLWVALWTVIGLRIHDAISAFSEAGRILQGGGANLQAAGADLGDALGSVPIVGGGLDTLATGAFSTAGEPFVVVGQELESMLILVARLLAALVIGVALVPWLARYLPWRADAAGDAPGREPGHPHGTGRRRAGHARAGPCDARHQPARLRRPAGLHA